MIDLRDEYNYQPELIAKLCRIYAVLQAHRYTYASLMALAGGAFLLQWSPMAASSTFTGYPWLGLPVLMGALWLLVTPLALIAKTLTLSVRWQAEFLSFRDLNWMRAMTDRHPALHPQAAPFLDSAQPVPMNALREFWPGLVRAEEQNQGRN
ncbi:hypothetical protein [Halothiobacillus sp. DCM-1]|uniref:hypothetical protein n=1 Tax=Halothiobacillus sp. DCM-1 TaxID=3112558 RepID=UPI003247E306